MASLLKLTVLAAVATTSFGASSPHENGDTDVVSTVKTASNELLDNILKGGISNNVYPGVAAMVGDLSDDLIYSGAFGNYEYSYNNSNSPAISVETSRFDLASVSKVIATTTAVGLLYQRGYLRMSDFVHQYIGNDLYSQYGKDKITIENCMLHNAGYFPDPDPNYYEQDFGCPNTVDYHPLEDFSCMPLVYDRLMNETLATPPGENYVYSDLSFITMQFVVGSIVYTNGLIKKDQLMPQCQNILYKFDNNINNGVIFDCYFEAFIRLEVFQSEISWVPTLGYLPDASVADQCVITTTDDSYRHTLVQGVVSDGNCYAMGGICGHAGLFTTIPDLGKFAKRLLVLATTSVDEEVEGPIYANWLNSTTVKYFIKEHNQTQSSRALGWTINDSTVRYLGGH
jgi:CubicO group peptidase (beta-lactamase class C family)